MPVSTPLPGTPAPGTLAHPPAHVTTHTPAASTPVYGARNVINAPQIKSAIAQRSTVRGDPPEVTQWLTSHLYRHIVGNLQAGPNTLIPVETLQDAQHKLGPQLPDWVLAHLQTRASSAAMADRPNAPADAGACLWWINPAGEEVLSLERQLVEFLCTRQGTSLEGKLMRVNAPQALAQWEAEHRAFELLQQQGWRQHAPEAVQPVWHGEHGCFVELRPESPLLRSELAYESQCMRHCVGQFANRRKLEGGYGEHYAHACENGAMRLFSYRSHGMSQPHITLSAHVREGGLLEIDQIKGKQNRPPVAKYRADVLGFLRHLPTQGITPEDALGMDLVRLPSGWAAIETIEGESDQLSLFRTHPHKLALLQRPSPLLQWLSLASAPEQTNALNTPAAVAATLALAAQDRRVS